AKLLLAVILITIFEGAVRKWFIVGSPALRYLTYFLKDIVFFFAAAVGALTTTRWQRLALATVLPISALLLFLPSVANVSGANAIGVLLSFRAYIILPCGAFLAAATVRS